MSRRSSRTAAGGGEASAVTRAAWLGVARWRFAAASPTLFREPCRSPRHRRARDSFKRGATLVEFFEFPKNDRRRRGQVYAEPAYPHPLQALSLFDFEGLRRVGFDHMRMPLDVGPLMAGGAQQQQEILDQLVAVVAAINAMVSPSW